MKKMCEICHANLSEEASQTSTACPACGGKLVAAPLPPRGDAAAQTVTVDHRGIVLPQRHAVGGIITPW